MADCRTLPGAEISTYELMLHHLNREGASLQMSGAGVVGRWYWRLIVLAFPTLGSDVLNCYHHQKEFDQKS